MTLEDLAKWHDDVAREYEKVCEDEPVARCHRASAAAIRALLEYCQAKDAPHIKEAFDKLDAAMKEIPCP